MQVSITQAQETEAARALVTNYRVRRTNPESALRFVSEEPKVRVVTPA